MSIPRQIRIFFLTNVVPIGPFYDPLPPPPPKPAGVSRGDMDLACAHSQMNSESESESESFYSVLLQTQETAAKRPPGTGDLCRRGHLVRRREPKLVTIGPVV